MSKENKTIHQIMHDAGFKIVGDSSLDETVYYDTATDFDTAHAKAVQGLCGIATCRRVNAMLGPMLAVTPLQQIVENQSAIQSEIKNQKSEMADV